IAGIQPGNVIFLITLISIYGAAANSLYPIAVAHANDFASPEDFVKVSGGLLLLYGIGTMIGPTVGGWIMTEVSPYSLFLVTATAHLAITAYSIFRTTKRATLPVEEKDSFATMTTAAAPTMTPEGAALDPRAVQQEDEAAHYKGAGI